jgi:uncharacterized protein with NRDE domain
MCTIIAFHRVHPAASLVIAANRDEFYARPSAPPHLLDAERRIYGGRDLQAGGTWLGVTPDGLFVAVTNQRTMAPPDPSRHSRGELVLQALRCRALDDVRALIASLDGRTYNPFNLLFGDGRELCVAYAREQREIAIESFAPGVVVLANDRVGAPEYPKTHRAEELVTPPPSLEGLEAVLADHEKPPLEASPEPPEGSRFNREFLRELQALCIHTPLYGTRSASILAINPGHTLRYLHADGPPCTTEFKDVTME